MTGMKWLLPSVPMECLKQINRFPDRIVALDAYRILMIDTCDAFFYPEDFSEFVPIAQVQHKIECYLRDFSERTVGIHIRRTDHQRSITESPTELFVRVMDEELSRYPDTRFYLATDDSHVKETLMRRYINQLITIPFELDRLTVSGVQNAVVDLFLLSHTVKIYGSSGSSFSETAAHIGRVPLEIPTIHRPSHGS